MPIKNTQETTMVVFRQNLFCVAQDLDLGSERHRNHDGTITVTKEGRFDSETWELRICQSGKALETEGKDLQSAVHAMERLIKREEEAIQAFKVLADPKEKAPRPV